MKRSVSCLLVFALVVSCIVASVSASEVVPAGSYASESLLNVPSFTVVSNGTSTTYESPQFSQYMGTSATITFHAIPNFKYARVVFTLQSTYSIRSASLNGYSMTVSTYGIDQQLSLNTSSLSLDSQDVFSLSLTFASAGTNNVTIVSADGYANFQCASTSGSMSALGLAGTTVFSQSGSLPIAMNVDEVNINSALDSGIARCTFNFNIKSADYFTVVVRAHGISEASFIARGTGDIVLDYDVQVLNDSAVWGVQSIVYTINCAGVDLTSRNLYCEFTYYASSTGVDSSGHMVYNHTFTMVSAVAGYYVQRDSITWWRQLLNNLSSGFADLSSRMQSFMSSVAAGFSELGLKIASGFEAVKTFLSGIWNTVKSGFLDVVSRLDQLINPDRSQQFEDDRQEIGDSVGAIEDFQQGNFDTIDSNMDTAMQDSSPNSIFGFVNAMVFVQTWTNNIFAGISKYKIIFILPIFLGIFFYICSRTPNVTHLGRPDSYNSSGKGKSAGSGKGNGGGEIPGQTGFL